MRKGEKFKIRICGVWVEYEITAVRKGFVYYKTSGETVRTTKLSRIAVSYYNKIAHVGITP